jgi:hypothetical protein
LEKVHREGGAFFMSVTKARATLANDVKRAKRRPGPESDARVTDARRDLAAAKLAAYITAVVEDAPDLTADQRSRLMVLLNGGRHEQR